MLKMSQRMLEAASFVDHGAKVADIGCDHAYISIFLIKEKIADSVIAMDVKKGPLEIAKKNIREAGVEEKIQLRLSNGFQALKTGETDTAIITGMGGLLIVSILTEGIQKMMPGFSLVLGPQSELFEVRSFLLSNGFRIREEKMLSEEGKYYTLIKAKYLPEDFETREENASYSEEELTFGRSLLEQKSSVLKEYLLKNQKLKQEILEQIHSESASGNARKQILGHELEVIQEALKAYSDTNQAGCSVCEGGQE